MQVTARIDYAVRALLELASSDAGRVTRDELADAQDIPRRYLESILLQLRREGLVVGQRGATGGYRLGRPADQITVADVSRAVDGPSALVQGQRPEHIEYEGTSRHLGELWVGLRAAGALRDGERDPGRPARRRAAGGRARAGRRPGRLAVRLGPLRPGPTPARPGRAR